MHWWLFPWNQCRRISGVIKWVSSNVEMPKCWDATRVLVIGDRELAWKRWDSIWVIWWLRSKNSSMKACFIHAQTQACRCMCRLPEEEMKPKYCLFVAARYLECVVRKRMFQQRSTCVYLHILDDGSHHKDLLRKYWMDWWAGLRPKYGPICCKVTR